MVLSSTEVGILDSHFKMHVERLLKLYQSTPRSVVWFLAGSLPAEALLHLRQFSLFSMICRLHDGVNVLANHARHMLATARPSAKSWFSQIQDLCLQYSLPHPISYLDNPPTKQTFKNAIKSKVIDFWEQKLRGEAAILPSLQYFFPNHMSLSSIHPMFTSCGGSPYQTKKAVVRTRYLSGRGRVEALTKHWDFSNKEGNCPLCVLLSPTLGTVEHLLLSGGCPALVDARLSMLSFIQAYMVPRPYLLPIMKACWGLADHLSMQQEMHSSTPMED